MDKERHSRTHRDDRDRDSSVDRSPERESSGRRQHRERRDSDHHHRSSSRRDDRDDERDRTKDRSREKDRSHEKESRSKRKDRDDENGDKETKKKSRFADEKRTSDVIVASSVESMATSQDLLTTKVSSSKSTKDDDDDSVNRSHEVHGSTDGTTVAASTGHLPLDAVAKAKRALMMGRGLADKLKNLPSLNKGTKAAPTVTATVQTHGIDLGSVQNVEAVKKAHEVATKLGFRRDPEFSPLLNLFSGTAELAVAQKPDKPPVLRVDALGREIDEDGNVISVSKPSSLSTLKVNINKKKKDDFQILKPQLEVDPAENPHFDPRMGLDKQKILRPKRMSFLFVEEGKWTRDAESIKLKSQFGEAKARELRVKQAHLAKATDNINPNLIEVSERVPRKEKPKETIPDVEWWDVSILVDGVYGDIADETVNESHLKTEKLTHYVEHPRPIEPPAEAPPPPPQPLKLTKKEQKKLRTQRRVAKEKEKQEMIRQGLLEPPKSKVKMSNVMRVLGSEATQDPTKLEREIRTAAAEREQAHTDRNAARKLTPSEKREKKERKLFGDPTALETMVSVYKINTKVSHPKTKFKIEMNAREYKLTGCSVTTDGMSVVVAEGKSKVIKNYGKVMLKRINWDDAVLDEEKDEDDMDEDDEKKGKNKCWLVWQGSVAKQSFYKFVIQDCLTDSAARKIFTDAGVGHYWDLALNYSED